MDSTLAVQQVGWCFLDSFLLAVVLVDQPTATTKIPCKFYCKLFIFGDCATFALCLFQYIQQNIRSDCSNIDKILEPPEGQDEGVWKYEHLRSVNGLVV